MVSSVSNNRLQQRVRFSKMSSLDPVLPRKRARNVKFPKTKAAMEKVVTVDYSNVAMDNWYTPIEYRNFKIIAHQESKKLIRLGQAAPEFGKSDCSTSRSVRQIGAEQLGLEMRGLEQIVDKAFGLERKRQKIRTIKSVLIAQHMAKEQDPDFDMSKLLAMVSSRESATATRFAQMMGRADEHAVHPQKKQLFRRQLSSAAA